MIELALSLTLRTALVIGLTEADRSTCGEKKDVSKTSFSFLWWASENIYSNAFCWIPWTGVG